MTGRPGLSKWPVLLFLASYSASYGRVVGTISRGIVVLFYRSARNLSFFLPSLLLPPPSSLVVLSSRRRRSRRFSSSSSWFSNFRVSLLLHRKQLIPRASPTLANNSSDRHEFTDSDLDDRARKSTLPGLQLETILLSLSLSLSLSLCSLGLCRFFLCSCLFGAGACLTFARNIRF